MYLLAFLVTGASNLIPRCNKCFAWGTEDQNCSIKYIWNAARLNDSSAVFIQSLFKCRRPILKVLKQTTSWSSRWFMWNISV